MGETPERSAQNGELLLALVDGRWPEKGGLVLDIGCGYGRLAYALARRGFDGRYVGIDITKRWVDWLQVNYTPVLPNYTFQWQDISNHHYNPSGQLEPGHLILPPVAASADIVLILSVFTHMKFDAIKEYLNVIGRCISSSCVVYATLFTLNDEQRRLEEEGRSVFPMQTPFGPHSRIFRPADPLYAIGHDEASIRNAVAEAGMVIDDVIFGRWCGRAESASYQDSYFLRRA
jgi:SAM-dependent methyltransferase